MSNAERNIPRIVRTLLAHQNKTQNDLAAHMNVGHSVISKALNGRRSWSVIDVEQMAEFFDVPVALFFGDPANLIRIAPGQQHRPDDDDDGGGLSRRTTQREDADNSWSEFALNLAA